MIMVQIGKNGLVYMPIICCLFIFILFFNIFGLLPYGYALTAHIIITFFFAFGFNLGLIFLGFYKYKLFFFKLFIPTGVTKFLIIFIFLIELISYFICTFFFFFFIIIVFFFFFIFFCFFFFFLI